MTDITEQIRQAVAHGLAEVLAGADIPADAVIEITIDEDDREEDHGDVS